MRRARSVLPFPRGLATIGVGLGGLSACDTPMAPSPYCPEWRPSGAATELWATDPDTPAVDTPPVPLRLNLPLSPELTAEVAQGNDGPFTHQGAQRFAWDFDVPLGTAVIAAADGVVVSAVGGHEVWGPEIEWRDSANRVVVDHGAGLFSAYIHLAADGVFVQPGERVRAGETVGVTGLSGQMTGPHLHFHVENAWSDTLPARFFALPTLTCDLYPAEGDLVTGGPSEAFDDTGPSDAPSELFADFGVFALEGIPARLLSVRRTYIVRGFVSDGSLDAVFLLIPEAGGRAVTARRWVANADGTFEGRLSLRDVPPGEYGWAIVATDGGDASVAKTVRCAVVE